MEKLYLYSEVKKLPGKPESKMAKFHFYPEVEKFPGKPGHESVFCALIRIYCRRSGRNRRSPKLNLAHLLLVRVLELPVRIYQMADGNHQPFHRGDLFDLCDR